MSVIYPKDGNATPSGGTFSITFPMASTHGVIKQVFVKPTTSSTVFDVYITDRFSNRIYYVTSNTGYLSTLVEIPVYGDVVLTVENASADEAFDYMISVLTEL